MQLRAHNWAEQNGEIVNALYNVVQAKVLEAAGAEFVYLKPADEPRTDAELQVHRTVNAARVRYYQNKLKAMVADHVQVAAVDMAAEMKRGREETIRAQKITSGFTHSRNPL